jgi:hypothetical protein
MLRDHHIDGYGKSEDKVVPYCYSCDEKAHIKARNSGQCTLSTKESYKKSRKSYARRTYRYKYINLCPNVYILIKINLNTNHIEYYSYFNHIWNKKTTTVDMITPKTI